MPCGNLLDIHRRRQRHFGPKAGPRVRRVRLVMLAPGPRHPRRSQAEIPLIGLSDFGRPALSLGQGKSVNTTPGPVGGCPTGHEYHIG